MAEKGNWIDDLGLAEFRAEVIKQAYRDYTNALLTVAAFTYTQVLNPGQNVTAEYKRIRKNAESISNSTWAKKHSTKGGINTRLRYTRQEAEAHARECEAFFRSRRFELFADNIHGETLIKYAAEQVERWKRDEITKAQVLPNNAEEGIAAAKDKRDKWRGHEQKTGEEA